MHKFTLIYESLLERTDFWKFSQIYFFGTKTSVVRVNPAGDQIFFSAISLMNIVLFLWIEKLLFTRKESMTPMTPFMKRITSHIKTALVKLNACEVTFFSRARISVHESIIINYNYLLMGEIYASVHNKLHLTLSEQFKFPAMSVLAWHYPLTSICLSYRFILAVICITINSQYNTS